MVAEKDIVVAPEGESAPSMEALGSDTMREFIRYFAASALALAVDAGTLALLTSGLNIPYLISGGISFTLGIIVIYVLSVRWVFETRAMRDARSEFLLFAGVGLIGLLINEGVLALLTGVFGFYYLLSKVASVVIVFTWNFIARKFLLFSRAA